jgi:hypothetical protein
MFHTYGQIAVLWIQKRKKINSPKGKEEEKELVTNRLRRLSKLGKRWSASFRQGKTCRDVPNEAESDQSTKTTSLHSQHKIQNYKMYRIQGYRTQGYRINIRILLVLGRDVKEKLY